MHDLSESRKRMIYAFNGEFKTLKINDKIDLDVGGLTDAVFFLAILN